MRTKEEMIAAVEFARKWLYDSLYGEEDGADEFDPGRDEIDAHWGVLSDVQAVLGEMRLDAVEEDADGMDEQCGGCTGTLFRAQALDVIVGQRMFPAGVRLICVSCGATRTTKMTATVEVVDEPAPERRPDAAE